MIRFVRATKSATDKTSGRNAKNGSANTAGSRKNAFIVFRNIFRR
jgi:hypothetical protein